MQSIYVDICDNELEDALSSYVGGEKSLNLNLNHILHFLSEDHLFHRLHNSSAERLKKETPKKFFSFYLKNHYFAIITFPSSFRFIFTVKKKLSYPKIWLNICRRIFLF